MEICKFCNKEFVPVRNSKGLFCSKQCNGKSKKKHCSREALCGWCGKLFQRPKAHFRSRHGIFFCSRQCKDSAQSFGSGSKIIPKHYKGLSYAHKIKKITCSDCSESRKYMLVIHHIDGNRLNNVKNNLECVCHNCHAKRHINIKIMEFDTQYLTPRDMLKRL